MNCMYTLNTPLINAIGRYQVYGLDGRWKKARIFVALQWRLFIGLSSHDLHGMGDAE